MKDVVRRLRHGMVAGWLPIVILAIWWVWSAESKSPFFPPLRTIVNTFGRTWGSHLFMLEVYPSLARLAAGLGLAIALGIGCGIVIGSSGIVKRAALPFVDFLRALPQTALIPLGIVLLGIGPRMQIGMIAFGSVWPVLLGTIDGVAGVDSLVKDVAAIYHLRKWQRFRLVTIRSASPQIIAGIRVAVALGIIMMVVSEMVASTNGLGYFILNAQQTFNIKQMWAGILMLGILGYLLNFIIVKWEQHVLKWHISSHDDYLLEKDI